MKHVSLHILIPDGIQLKIASTRFPLGAYFRGSGHKIPANGGTCLIDGAGRVILFPLQKRAAMKIASVVGGNEMVSRPHGMLVVDYGQDICTPLPFPTKHVFIPDIGDEVGKAAFSTAMASLSAGTIIQVHHLPCSRGDIHTYKDPRQNNG